MRNAVVLPLSLCAAGVFAGVACSEGPPAVPPTGAGASTTSSVAVSSASHGAGTNATSGASGGSGGSSVATITSGGSGGLGGSSATGGGRGGAGGLGSASAGSGGVSGSSSASAGSGGATGVFCNLPGSIQHTASGVTVVPGATSPVDLSFLSVPVGFCAHYFGTVGNARQLRFAPGGELFVASPTTSTTGGGGGGKSAIVVLPDDNHDGIADTSIQFLGSLPSTQGLLFAPGLFYYQDGTKIMSVPYKAGDRAPSAAGTQVADITVYSSGLHWPKVLDIADDGTIYVGNGGDQGEACDPAHPFHGGILKLDGTPGGTPVAKGFRNPIAIRCSRGHNLCFASELAKDYSAAEEGREKLVPIRQGDDWGFPCCATKNTPYQGITADCSTVTPDTNSFVIGDTPFGVDFEPGIWPAPFTGSAFVTTHGVAGSWAGARLVSIAIDPTTGLPMPSTDTSGANTGAMSDFATGWDDATRTHGRPAALTFASDGRLFVSNDQNGVIFWIAPLSL